MNNQRITISLPANIYTLLTQRVDSGNISRYISETIHNRLVEEAMKKKLKKDPLKEFLGLRKTTRKLPVKRVLAALHKGRRMEAL